MTRKIQTIGTATLTTSYGYDSGGRLASVTYPSGKQAVYAYDAAGRISGVTANAQTLVTGVTYTPFGIVSGWTAGNGAVYRRAIDLDGRIAGLALPASDNIALAYDAASRITGLTESGLAARTFGYDALDRLTNYKSGTATQTYTYDADGNRTGYATNATPPVSLAYNVDPASNRLLGISGSSTESFTYDAAGNTLSHSSPSADFRYDYDARNRLAVSWSGAAGTTQLINGLGQRVGRIGEDSPVVFAYDEAGHLIGQYGASAVAETVWLGDSPVAVLQPTGQFYVAPDHLDAPHQITSAAGQVVWLWDHDPFGNGDPVAPGGFSYSLRFPGQFYDARARLHYNYFRDYDPGTGRYIESDPIGLAGGVNTYGYARQNPVQWVDPTGLISFLGTVRFFGGVGEAFSGAAFGVATVETGVGPVAGVAVAWHGVDTAIAAWNGTDTVTSQAMQLYGDLPQSTANNLDACMGVVGSAGTGVGIGLSKVAAIRASDPLAEGLSTAHILLRTDIGSQALSYAEYLALGGAMTSPLSKAAYLSMPGLNIVQASMLAISGSGPTPLANIGIGVSSAAAQAASATCRAMTCK